MYNTHSSECLTCEDVSSDNWGLLQPLNSTTTLFIWRHFCFKAKLAKLATDTPEPSSTASTDQQCDEGKSSMVELRIRLPDGQVKRVTSVEFIFLIVLNLQTVSNWLKYWRRCVPSWTSEVFARCAEVWLLQNFKYWAPLYLDRCMFLVAYCKNSLAISQA